MKSIGIVRKVDQLGRIVLPKELRFTYDIKINDPIEIFVEEEMIILKKYNPSCIFCGESRNVSDYKGKRICPECRDDM